MTPFGLYIHIPYCDSKCPYCDFNSYAVARWPEATYTAALCRELRTRAGEAEWEGRPVASVFFGGGTPSLFAPESIAVVLECARALWPLAEGVEITLEANPGTVDVDKLRGFRSAGVNRISFGVQSFHAHHLRTLGRIHSAEQAQTALAEAHAAGFDNVNLDLIFALPEQSLAEWREDLDRACAQGTRHVSAYNLTYEEGTAFHRWRAERRLVPLDDEAELAMFDTTRSRLAAHGLAAYEISNFACPGFECRHNLNYWRGGDYVGVGAGAHSFARRAGDWGRRWGNVRSPVGYERAVVESGLAEASSEWLDRRQAAGELVFLGLRCSEGMSLAAFSEYFDGGFAELFPQASRYLEDGMLEVANGRLRLSPRGLRLADGIFADFL